MSRDAAPYGRHFFRHRGWRGWVVWGRQGMGVHVEGLSGEDAKLSDDWQDLLMAHYLGGSSRAVALRAVRCAIDARLIVAGMELIPQSPKWIYREYATPRLSLGGAR
jgi:hypothetical protein